jgi:hypothetical protein
VDTHPPLSARNIDIIHNEPAPLLITEQARRLPFAPEGAELRTAGTG